MPPTTAQDDSLLTPLPANPSNPSEQACVSPPPEPEPPATPSSEPHSSSVEMRLSTSTRRASIPLPESSRSSMSSSSGVPPSDGSGSSFYHPQHTAQEVPEDEAIAPLLSSLSSMRLESRAPSPYPPQLGSIATNSSPSEGVPQPRHACEESTKTEDDHTASATFMRSIRQGHRNHALIDRRTTFLENEFALLRTECANSVHASRRLLLKTQEAIKKECRSMAQAQEGTAETVHSLEHKLAKAQCAIAILEAQRLADRQTIESMAKDIADFATFQERLVLRLQRLDECEQSMRETREIVTELVYDSSLPLNFPSTTPSTLADELASTSPAEFFGVMSKDCLDLSVGTDSGTDVEVSPHVKTSTPSSPKPSLKSAPIIPGATNATLTLDRILSMLLPVACVDLGEHVKLYGRRAMHLTLVAMVSLRSDANRVKFHIVLVLVIAFFAVIFCVNGGTESRPPSQPVSDHPMWDSL